jgi:hypothetical protein
MVMAAGGSPCSPANISYASFALAIGRPNLQEEEGTGRPAPGFNPYFPFAAAGASFLVSRLMSTFTSSPRSTPPLSMALFQTIP